MAAKLQSLLRRLSTVRGRTTALATIIVALMFALASIVLVTLLQRSLVDNIDRSARPQAMRLASLARDDSLSEILDSGNALYQILDEEGQVITSSSRLDKPDLFKGFRPNGTDPEERTIEDLPLGDDDTFRVTALTASSPSGKVTIYVATSLEAVEETIAILQGALAVGSPILLALVAFTAWVVVGRALQPVEDMRTAVEEISEHSLHKRVPVGGPQDEISRLASTMNTMLERVESSYERQRRFAADASHELQTPLASARTDLEVALAHPEEADWPRIAKDLVTANMRMERLARDLLFLAGVEERGALARLVPVNLDDIVLDEVTRMRPSARVTIDTNRVSGAEVRGRRSDLERVVRNLLDNACVHATSRVEVGLTGEDQVVTLTVADDGSGIPADRREEIFDRFTRLEEARSRDDGGAGLGLAITKEIIEAHGGTVGVEDSTKGSRFVVRLPTPP